MNRSEQKEKINESKNECNLFRFRWPFKGNPFANSFGLSMTFNNVWLFDDLWAGAACHGFAMRNDLKLK